MNNSKKKTLIYRVAAFLVIMAIAAVMFVIGRGHTVYFDNKSSDLVAEVPYKIEVRVDGKKVASLKKNERGMVDVMGQKLTMELVVTEEKGGDTVQMKVTQPLPYNMDGIILNIPAMLKGASQDQYVSEFISVPSESDAAEEVVVTDDTAGLMDFGEESEASQG